MWKDPIVEEIRSHRTKIANESRFGIRRIVADAQPRQKTSRQAVVSPPRRQDKQEAWGC